MAITLYHIGRTPQQRQYNLVTFMERYKASEAADVVMLDSGVPQEGDAHPDYPHMYVVDRHCSESGERASELEVQYLGVLLDDGGGNPVLPTQEASSSGEVASATTNTSSVIYPSTATNPASVQFYAKANRLSFISDDPADPSEPTDPDEITEPEIITWDLGFGVQPQCHDDIVTFLLTQAFVQGIIEPPPTIDPIVDGQFYRIVKQKTRTLFPYNPAC